MLCVLCDLLFKKSPYAPCFSLARGRATAARRTALALDPRHLTLDRSSKSLYPNHDPCAKPPATMRQPQRHKNNAPPKMNFAPPPAAKFRQVRPYPRTLTANQQSIYAGAIAAPFAEFRPTTKRKKIRWCKNANPRTPRARRLAYAAPLPPQPLAPSPTRNRQFHRMWQIRTKYKNRLIGIQRVGHERAPQHLDGSRLSAAMEHNAGRAQLIRTHRVPGQEPRPAKHTLPQTQRTQLVPYGNKELPQRYANPGDADCGKQPARADVPDDSADRQDAGNYRPRPAPMIHQRPASPLERRNGRFRVRRGLKRAGKCRAHKLLSGMIKSI